MTARTASILLGTALALAGCDSSGSAEGSATETRTMTATTSSATTTRATPLAPGSFEAAAAPRRVVLRWTVPTDGDAVETYEITRDGRSRGTVSGTETSYTDRDVSPGTAYRYGIQSRSGGGTSDEIFVEARTKVPPLKAARLQGAFNVTTKTLSSSGYQNSPEAPSLGWRFRPKCKVGACSVVWNDLHARRVRTLLRRSGARYGGTYTGFFNVLCAGTRSTSTVTVELRVKRARMIGGEWRAARFVGTVKQSEASQLGCITSGATLSVRGRLIALS